jgi:hypothetical protein
MPIESEIRARVDAFAADLVSLIKASAMDVVQEALGEGAPARGRRRGPGRPPRAASRRPKGAKRDPKVLEALTEKLGAFIKKNPGQRIEQIGKALGVATKELALPVKKLIAAKRVSTKGQKRATTYYSAGGRRTASASKKAKPSKGRAARRPKRKASGRRAKAAPAVKAAEAPPAPTA